jgi:hypothetical protein
MRPLIAALLLGAVALGAQRPSSYSYDFRAVTGDDGHPMTGTVRVNGSRARIDVDHSDGDDDGQYLLLSADGQVVTIVKPRDRTFSVFDADQFSHLASLGIGAAGKALTMRVRESSFQTRSLGDGDRIAGRPTQRARLVEHWRMDVGAMGFTTPMDESVETEYSFDPTLTLVRNPLLELLAISGNALPASDRKYAATADSVRRSIVRGTPLRTVVTERKADGEASRTVIEVTRYAPANVNTADLAVPTGYTRKDSGLPGFRLKR